MISAIKSMNKSEYLKALQEAISTNGTEEAFKVAMYHLISKDNVNFVKETLKLHPNFVELSHTIELPSGQTALELAAKRSPQIFELLK